MKPQLANDALLDLLIYPVILQPKIDGVRGMNISGTFTGRSLNCFSGFGITDYFSQPEFLHLDGEMTLGSDPKSIDRLCSRTTGAIDRFKKVTEMADMHWWVFDDLQHAALPYMQRYELLAARVEALNHPRIHLVPAFIAHNREELDDIHAQFLEDGYEGTILRNPNAPAKSGRPTQKGQELWRIKPWADSEILVTGVTEGAKNTNEAKINALGRTERSSAKAGMVPNGMIGSIEGIMLDDFLDPLHGEIMFAKGLAISIGTGEMTEVEAEYYFRNQNEIVGKCIKFRHMTHGVKDLPRFGTYISHRTAADRS